MSSLQHVGTDINIHLHIVAMSIKAFIPWDSLLYVLIEKKKGVTANPLSHSCTTYFVSWSLLRLWPANKLDNGQTSEKRVVQVWKSTKDARNFPTWTVTCTQLVPRHAYLSCHLWTTDTTSAKSLCSLHPYHTLQQPTVNFRRTKILSIIKSGHQRHISVREIFMFRVQHFLTATANSEKNDYTKLHKTRVLLHIQHATGI
jgi:hypothetical protein